MKYSWFLYSSIVQSLELNNTANKLDLEIDFIVTHPYWVYSIDKKENKLLLDKELNNKVEKLICNSFQVSEKINKIFISQVPETLNLEDLSFDKRHLKSSKIDLREYKKICKYWFLLIFIKYLS